MNSYVFESFLLLNSEVTLTFYCLVPNAKDKAKKKKAIKRRRKNRKKKTNNYNNNDGCHFGWQKPSLVSWTKKKVFIWVNQHGKRALNVHGVMVSEQFRKDGSGFWWMWTLHPSMPKAQAHPIVFLTHVLNSLLAWTYQCSLASTDTERLWSTSGTLLKITCSYEMQECVCYKSLGPHAT